MTVSLEGNAWKRIPLSYTVTSKTILEFEVTSTDQGEILAIGLDEDTDYSNAVRGLQLGGSDVWNQAWQGMSSYITDDKTYRIPVGEFYTGQMSNLFFVADDDADGSTDVVLKTIMIYEDQ